MRAGKGVGELRVAIIFIIMLVNSSYSQIIEGIKSVEQQFNEWCWVASSWIVIDYYESHNNGTQLQQCDIAEYTRIHSKFHDFGAVSCCETSDPLWNCNYWNYNYAPDSGSIKMILIDMAGIQNYGVARMLTIEECRNECRGGRPFIIRIDSPGHFVVGYGIENGNLYYSDPWPGQGFCVEPYGDSLHGNRKWTHTNIMTTDPPSRCTPPENVSLKNVTETSATVTWDTNEVAIAFDLQYRSVTESQWTLFKKLPGNGFTIANLNPAHEYEVSVRSFCSGNNSQNSAWTESLYFHTQGCDTPFNFTHGHITENSAVISWEPVSQASYHLLQYKTAADSVWKEQAVNGHVITLDSLQKNTRYQYRIRSICDGMNGYSKWSVISEFITSGGTYSVSKGGPGAFLKLVQIDTIKMESGSGDYFDYSVSGPVFVLKPGNMYRYQFNSANSDSCYFMSWIDFNNDYMFIPGEQICSHGPDSMATGSFTVPLDVKGISRLRVSVKDKSQQSGPDDIFNSGEVEDYCVYFDDSLRPFPTNIKIVHLDSSEFKINWDPVAQARSFDIRYKSISQQVWKNISSKVTEIAVSCSLEPGITYEIQVRSIFTAGSSIFSPSLNFTIDKTRPEPANRKKNSVFTITFPGQGVLSFPVNESYDASWIIQIFSIDGKLVESHSCSGYRFVFNRKNLSKGLYIFQLKNKNCLINKPLLITGF